MVRVSESFLLHALLAESPVGSGLHGVTYALLAPRRNCLPFLALSAVFGSTAATPEQADQAGTHDQDVNPNDGAPKDTHRVRSANESDNGRGIGDVLSFAWQTGFSMQRSMS